MAEMWRQGDLLIKRVEAVPEGAKKSDDLGVGEDRAGREQRLTKGAVLHVKECYEDGCQRNVYLLLDEPAEIVHEVHKPIALPPGAYRVIRRRQYEPEGV